MRMPDQPPQTNLVAFARVRTLLPLVGAKRLHALSSVLSDRLCLIEQSVTTGAMSYPALLDLIHQAYGSAGTLGYVKVALRLGELANCVSSQTSVLDNDEIDMGNARKLVAKLIIEWEKSAAVWIAVFGDDPLSDP